MSMGRKTTPQRESNCTRSGCGPGRRDTHGRAFAVGPKRTHYPCRRIEGSASARDPPRYCPESRDGYILFDSNMVVLVTGAQDACSGKLTEYEGGEVVDVILMYVRFGSNIGSTPVDGNGGIDCGDGTVIGGTGENIFPNNDPDAFALTGNPYDNGVVVPPLVP